MITVCYFWSMCEVAMCALTLLRFWTRLFGNVVLLTCPRICEYFLQLKLLHRRYTMAQGNQLGEFKLTSTSTTFTPGPGAAITVQVNFEGEATGETGGQHRGTLVVVGAPGAKSGTYSYCGVTLQGNGEVLGLSSQGTVEDI